MLLLLLLFLSWWIYIEILFQNPYNLKCVGFSWLPTSYYYLLLVVIKSLVTRWCTPAWKATQTNDIRLILSFVCSLHDWYADKLLDCSFVNLAFSTKKDAETVFRESENLKMKGVGIIVLFGKYGYNWERNPGKLQVGTIFTILWERTNRLCFWYMNIIVQDIDIWIL